MIALNVNFAFEEIEETLHNSESEPGAVEFSDQTGMNLIKRIKYFIQLFRWDADACILDEHLNPIPIRYISC